MNTTHTHSQPLSASSRKGVALALVEMLALAGALALAAQVRVQIGPVPYTLQTLPVLVAPYLLGRGRASGGAAMYLGLGLLGAPLFTAAQPHTLGYIAAWMLVPFVARAFTTVAAGLAASTALIYAMGVPVLKLTTGMPWEQAILFGMLVFLPWDAAKGVMAWSIVKGARKRGWAA
jgi:biotin transport system substrate-specific component